MGVGGEEKIRLTRFVPPPHLICGYAPGFVEPEHVDNPDDVIRISELSLTYVKRV